MTNKEISWKQSELQHQQPKLALLPVGLWHSADCKLTYNLLLPGCDL